ncbi:hypothetical protein ACJX0J_037034 [Zea mays]
MHYKTKEGGDIFSSFLFHFFLLWLIRFGMQLLIGNEAHHDQFQIFLGIRRLMQKMSAIYITSVHLYFYLLHILKLHMLIRIIHLRGYNSTQGAIGWFSIRSWYFKK